MMQSPFFRQQQSIRIIAALEAVLDLRQPRNQLSQVLEILLLPGSDMEDLALEDDGVEPVESEQPHERIFVEVMYISSRESPSDPLAMAGVRTTGLDERTGRLNYRYRFAIGVKLDFSHYLWQIQ